jgi:hypothetical protein
MTSRDATPRMGPMKIKFIYTYPVYIHNEGSIRETGCVIYKHEPRTYSF